MLFYFHQSHSCTLTIKFHTFTTINQNAFMKKYFLLGAGLVAGVISFNSCKVKSDQATQKFLDPTNIDSSVKPGDDFFLYANGAWIKKTVIPPTDNQAGGFYDL